MGEKEEQTFQQSKSLLNTRNLLIHYDPKKPLIVACYASPYGLGVVISHVMPNKSKRLILFISRTLTNAERNYSQIGKESLAITFALRKFHQYIYGQTFTIQTDHKPLRGFLWSIILSAYDYKLCYHLDNENNNANCISRLHFNNESYEKHPVIDNHLFVIRLIHAPVTAKEVALYTNPEPILSKVINYINYG